MAPKVREIIRRLERDGWSLVATRGSHRQYKHPTKPGKVTVAGKPNDEPSEAIWRNIQKQVGRRP